MKKKYSFPIGIAFLAAIFILFTSYIPADTHPEENWPELGKYELSVKGDQELNLQGRIFYDYLVGTDQPQDQISTCRLQLRDENNRIEHSFDFYIADQKNIATIKQGDYLISKNIDGFFKDFKGVFGVADISELGELPFFTEKGKITISYAEDESIAGILQLILSNNMGETIEVEGKFFAPKDF